MAASAPYAVAVLGGGAAGCATAIALRRLGVEGVLVADAGRPGRTRLGESIPPDARVPLERLGLWEGFLAEAHEPCLGSCSAWGGEALGFNDFVFNPHGSGWHLDRARFDAFLAARAAAAGAEVRQGLRFEAARRERDVHVLRLSGREVRARLVVDATGRGSRFARAMGARQLQHDRLTCVGGFPRLRAGAEFTRLTMLEAVEYGWWYAARLPGDRLAVAVGSDPDGVRDGALHTPEGFLAGLRATRHVAAEVAGAGLGGEGVVARTAPSFVLDRAAGPDWLAAGDAAAAYDPIASQGLYWALRDGLDAAAAVAARSGGDARALDRYADGVAARFADYLANRNHLYGLERRWSSAPFWRRRAERTGAR